MQTLSHQEIASFRETIWDQGRELFRSMPWRDDTAPYKVLVSEIMLQQTQVDRVRPKFEAFLDTFPSIEALAVAPLSEVLQLWSGLGYNRRAKFLHEAAKMIVSEYNGVFPDDEKGLKTLPGVGVNTAGAILAYSFNKPALFIETNVRTVYFHHFFADKVDITDAELKQYLEATMDTEHPREWYWALMDYGTFLKRQGVGAISKSKHYKKQAPLKGSVREVRGIILKTLSAGPVSVSSLAASFEGDERFAVAYEGLLRDGLIKTAQDTVHLAD